MESLRKFNALEESAALQALMRCCGSTRWAETVAAKRPFATPQQLYDAAEIAWTRTTDEDVQEAMTHHPRIGDKAAFKKKWAGQEQAGAAAASDAILEALAAGNAEYEKKFGHIFLICATGLSAEDMLGYLRTRLGNEPARELQIAAAEQAKIMRLRLEKLLRDE